MSDNEIYPDEPQDATLDLDDVEGHGLKEVAAGLGAAAVLAGGAAGATSLAHSSATVHPSKGGPGITIEVSDPIGTAVDLTDRSIAGAQSARDAALDKAFDVADDRIDKAQAAVQSLPSDLDRAVDKTTGIAKDSVAWAGDVASDTVDTATSTVNRTAGAASTTARTATGFTAAVADKTVDRTEAGVSSVPSRANSAVSSTAGTADRKVATVLSVVTTTSADAVHTAKVTLNSADAGAGVNGAGGWVLIKDGDKVLAQVQMVGGSATASWTMPVLGSHSITVNYTGDSAFAPSIRAITL